MNHYLYETFNKLTNEDLTHVIQGCKLDYEAHEVARRVLKDRLEGLDDFVKAEALADKIVSA